MSDAVVGVIVPVLNVEPWLDTMLRSLRAQTYPNWRAAVVDDGSTDGTFEIALRHAAEEPRLVVSRTPGAGPGARRARIHGRSLLPDADVLCFADGDDVMLPPLLERVVARLASRPDAAAVLFRLLECRPDGSVGRRGKPWWTPTRFWLRPLRADRDDVPIPFLLGGAIPEASVAIRARHYDACGGLDAAPAIGSSTFRDLLLRLALGAPVVALDEHLYVYRLHDRQASRNREQLRRDAALLDRHLRDAAARDPRVAAALAETHFVLRHRLAARKALRRAGELRREGDWRGAASWARRALARYRPLRPRPVRRGRRSRTGAQAGRARARRP